MAERMENDFNDTITKLSQDSDIIVINPKDVETFRSKGIPLKVVLPESVEVLFEKRLKTATVVRTELPPIPNELFSQSITSLYKEIQECILFNLNGAAITLLAILLEFALKRTTFVKEMGGYGQYDTEKWDEFENLDFAGAIGRAKKAGLLESKAAKDLHWFREVIRNPYIHYNIKTITKGTMAEKTRIVDINTGNFVEKDIAAEDSPIIQAIAKPIVDRSNVIQLFKFVDDAVKYLIKRLNERI